MTGCVELPDRSLSVTLENGAYPTAMSVSSMAVADEVLCSNCASSTFTAPLVTPPLPMLVLVLMFRAMSETASGFVPAGEARPLRVTNVAFALE